MADMNRSKSSSAGKPGERGQRRVGRRERLVPLVRRRGDLSRQTQSGVGAGVGCFPALSRRPARGGGLPAGVVGPDRPFQVDEGVEPRSGERTQSVFQIALPGLVVTGPFRGTPDDLLVGDAGRQGGQLIDRLDSRQVPGHGQQL